MIGTDLRLNLGSRDRKIPGFANMDIDAHEGVEFVGDVSDLSRFESGAVSEIYASQILEHFPHTETLKVLTEWGRVLRPQGILWVGVPDFKRAVELYQKVGMQDWIVNQLWGDQTYKTAFHYCGFDADRLADLLFQAGFSEVYEVSGFPYGADCSSNLDNIEGKPVALRMQAVK